MDAETLILYRTSLLCAVAMSLAGWVFLLKSQVGAMHREKKKLERELRRIRALMKDEVQLLGRQRLNARLDQAEPDAFRPQAPPWP